MKRHVVLLAIGLCVLTASHAAAQSDLGLKGLGVAVGYVSPDDLDGTFSIGVFADHGTITPQIGIESRLDFWSQSEEAFGSEASVRDITLGLRGKYFFEVAHPKIRPFAGAGLGLHFVHAEVTIPPMFGNPGMTVEDSSTEFGLDLGGGLTTPIGPKTDFLGELWYVISDVSQFTIRVGMSYSLGS